MRVLIKHLDLSKKLEKVNIGETILSCWFSQHICAVVVERKMPAEGSPILLRVCGLHHKWQAGWKIHASPESTNSWRRKRLSFFSKIFWNIPALPGMAAGHSDYMMPVTCLPWEITEQKIKPARENVPYRCGPTISISALWWQWRVLNRVKGGALKVMVKWEKRYWGWASKREENCYYRVTVLKLIQVRSECNVFSQLCQEEYMR